MTKIHCLNSISKVGTQNLKETYEMTDSLQDADAVLVRSANMHELELSDRLVAIARAGAGVNNIPLDKCTEQGIVVFNTPGANANGVKGLPETSTAESTGSAKIKTTKISPKIWKKAKRILPEQRSKEKRSA